MLRPWSVSQGYGLVLGLFPVNILHNLVHLLFGVLGLAAYAGTFSAFSYARIVAVSYGLLTVMGLIPGLNTTFGLVPIYGADVALHAVIAAVSAYFGFAVRAGDPVSFVSTGTSSESDYGDEPGGFTDGATSGSVAGGTCGTSGTCTGAVASRRRNRRSMMLGELACGLHPSRSTTIDTSTRPNASASWQLHM